MKMCVSGTNWFLLVMLIALFASYSYGAQKVMTGQDEIGEKWTMVIKQKLKEPFLTLLASSEFIDHKELLKRIQDVEEVLKSFKNDVSAEYEKAPVEPVASQAIIPVATAPAPTAEHVEPVAVPTPTIQPAPVMVGPTMTAPIQTEPVTASTPSSQPAPVKVKHVRKAPHVKPMAAPAPAPIATMPMA